MEQHKYIAILSVGGYQIGAWPKPASTRCRTYSRVISIHSFSRVTCRAWITMCRCLDAQASSLNSVFSDTHCLNAVLWTEKKRKMCITLSTTMRLFSNCCVDPMLGPGQLVSGVGC